MRWDLGIDLGTENIRLTESGSEPFLETADILAYRRESREPFAAGNAAKALEGRECLGARTVRPLWDGTLHSAEAVHDLFDWIFAMPQAQRYRHFSALITCSPTARPVQADAIVHAAAEAGATCAALVRSDAACAVGAGLNITEPEGSMLIDLGAGKITATLFTMGRVAEFAALPYGMDCIDRRIRRTIRSLGYAIGKASAAELKYALGTVRASGSVRANTAGLNLAKRQPEVFSVPQEIVAQTCADVVREVTDMAVGIVERAPAELAADLFDSGVILCGGGSLLSGIDKALGDALGISCCRAEAPTGCAVRGLSAMMRSPEKYEAFFSDIVRNEWH